MTEVQRGKITGKLIGMLILVAIVVAVVSTLLQTMLLGRSNPAITGGVAGAIIAMLVLSSLKKKSE